MTGTFLKENKSPDSLFPASLLQSKAMLMREVKPFPSLPAAQAATFISPDKIKKPNPKLLEQACIFQLARPAVSLSREENSSRSWIYPGGCTNLPPLPLLPAGISWNAGSREVLPPRSPRGVLGTSWASCPQGGLGAQQHMEQGCWQCLPAGITSCWKKLLLE